MDLTELQEMSAKDLKIDDQQLDIESLKTPELYGKYLKIFTRWNLLLKQVESKHRILYRQKWEYYGGKADPEVYKEKPLDLKILKQDVPIYLEGDEELIESQHTVEYHKAMCDHAEKMCKMLNNRGFQIKNAIDWKRFMEGSI
jgi:hypothetical protein|tara:strand:+ start:631 stop:1059 length:429 start_codon:yes stop_codon:yes gene_type:complete